MKSTLLLFIALLLHITSVTGQRAMWLEESKEVASDRDDDDLFGRSVALSGPYMVVGAPGKESAGTPVRQNVGAVYVFEFDSATGQWQEMQNIANPNNTLADEFGKTVTIDSVFLAVGSTHSGTFIYELDTNGQWNQMQQITGGVSSLKLRSKLLVRGDHNEQYDANGLSAINEAGAAYIYELDSNHSWTRIQKIVGTNRQSNGRFGYSVDINDQKTIIVGSPLYDFYAFPSPQFNRGAAYFFEPDTTGRWQEVRKILGVDDFMNLGHSVAIDGNEAIAGGPFGSTSDGEAYFFSKDTTGVWQFLQAVQPVSPSMHENFGSAVSISGNRAVIGAEDARTPGQFLIFENGKAYVFEKNTQNSWLEKQFLVASDSATQDHFGSGVAIEHGNIVVGAYHEDHDTAGLNFKDQAGSAYCFVYCVPDTFYHTIIGCDSLVLGDTVFTSSGTYTRLLTNRRGCDSTVIVALQVRDRIQTTDTVTACERYTWFVNDSVYTTSGMYIDSAGCGIADTLILTILPNHYDTVSTVVSCAQYTWPRTNTTYFSSGFYVDSLINNLGCDSLIILDLTINPEYRQQLAINACDSFYWDLTNTMYFSSGVYRDTLTTAFGCDSIMILDLTIGSPFYQIDSITACDSYQWPVNNFVYPQSGIYYDSLVASTGCDSIHVLHLTINHSFHFSESAAACDSFTWALNQTTYVASGAYTVSMSTTNGCDSTYTLNLFINKTQLRHDTIVACGQYTWPHNNQTYTTSGFYGDTVIASTGCAIISTLYLTVHPIHHISQTVTSCGFYTWSVNNTTYPFSGTYIDTSTSSLGCDSITTLNLTVLKNTFNTEWVTACDEYVWPVNNDTLRQSGLYLDTLVNAIGCDSILLLHLTIKHSTFNSQYKIACDSYTWPLNNMTYTQSGRYNYKLPNTVNSVGCDSIISLFLTVYPDAVCNQKVTACDSYTWPANQMTYTQSGSYSHTLITAQGVDSTVMLTLTIYATSYQSFQETACDSYTWPVNNVSYTQSGVYTDTLTSTSGCDSIMTLSLTILNSSASSVQVNNCGPYTWPVNNTTYSTSGTYQVTIPNTAGCDSVLTLNLVILQSSSDTSTVTSCTQYTWPVTQRTYRASGIHTETLVNAAGCDSILTLDLTITQVNTNITVSGDTLRAEAMGANYQWLDCLNGYTVIAGATAQTYIAPTNGNYAVRITENNCTDTSACQAILHLSRTDQTFARSIQLYPNPTSGQLTINLGTTYSGVQLTIRDLQGKEVSSQYYEDAQELKAELTGAKGLYLLELRTANGQTAIFEVVKE